jgi:hypothetical protein
VPNPAYYTWISRDQLVMGYLANSPTEDVLA